MKIAVLIPWHTDNGPRAAAWNYLRPKWNGVSDELVIGCDPRVGETGKFSVARAINNAAAHSEADAFVLYGADHIPDPDAIAHARNQLAVFEWTRLYSRVSYACKESTEEWIATDAAEQLGEWFSTPAPCYGVLGVRRDLFARVGGMDERYEGWGYEDTAFVDALAKLAPGGEAFAGQLLELWHPGDGRVLHGTANANLYWGTRS